MKNLYKVTGTLCLFFISFFAYSQGCVAIRSACGANVGGGVFLEKNQWQAGTNFRYFRSYRHFRGKHEETERVENGTEVINNSAFLDLQLSYGLTDRLSLNFVLPFVYHHRTSMYEHGGNPTGVDDSDTPDFDESTWQGDRNATVASGLADIRFSASYWLFEPASKGNLSVGLGFKLPSGDYRAQDTFYNKGDNKDEEITADVDQSIQPGDGGFGVTLDLQGFYSLTDNITLTSNFYYLSNPRESFEYTNFRGSTSDRSVPDQYAARLGAFYMTSIHGLGLYAGGRVEGVPSSDLIGGDEGGRRPGYAVSVEPGISYGMRNFSLNLTVPIAVERARTQSLSDKQTTSETGVFRNGDAAFADYLINFGFTYRFGGQKPVIDFSEN
ncbi:MAG: transporter [Marinoscillum sp.]